MKLSILFFVGLLIFSFGMEVLWGNPWGWINLGSGLMIYATATSMLKYLNRKL